MSIIQHDYLERLVDLTDPSLNRIYNLTLEQAQARLLDPNPEAVREIEGSFALVAKQGKAVKLARSMDRPLRYFLAKRHEGPALIVADRIDTIHEWLKKEGFGDQFHPSYTRMVPAHYVTTVQLIGCPDPDPDYERFFTPKKEDLPADLDVIGERYIRALESECLKWLSVVDPKEPVGLCFSGGIDSGAVFLTLYHAMLKKGMSPSRLKAFTLTMGDGPDLDQSRNFLKTLDLEMFLEPIEANWNDICIDETLKIVEDYKPLDIEAASMLIALLKGIRREYPDWKYLVDGDGGDENLKDYPIEENPELTIRSVLNNLMLYQEGWGVGKIKHSLTYSGGLSRSITRGYAPLQHFHFEGFSPFCLPNVMEVAEGIPYTDLTQYDVPKLYTLKGEIVSRGIKSVTGFDMPVFEKRRFQHGATQEATLRSNVTNKETELRRKYHGLYES